MLQNFNSDLILGRYQEFSLGNIGYLVLTVMPTVQNHSCDRYRKLYNSVNQCIQTFLTQIQMYKYHNMLSSLWP